MRATQLRLAAAWLALVVVVALPQAVDAASGGKVSLQVPSSVTPGVVAAVTLRLPKTVAAVDGRILVASGAADLVGVAPVGKGSALSPVAIDGGFAFGAYGLAPKGGTVTLRLVLVPKVSGNLGLRVLIDALSGPQGNRLLLTSNALTGSLRVTGRSVSIGAPAGSARSAPGRAAGPLRPVFGRATIGVEDTDIVRAAWYETRAQTTECAPASSRAADANNDGCIDIVDLQAITVAQGSRLVAGATGSAAAASATSAAPLNASLSVPNPARTFTVTSTADTPDATPGNAICADSTGACTLRAALTESNWQAGLTRINFNLAGTAPVTIQLGTTSLPNVGTSTSRVYIDGYSQPGSKPNDAATGTDAIPGVEIRGPNAATSQWDLYVPSAGNTFRGLLLNNAQRGILLDGPNASSNVVIGNWMGFNRDNSLPARGAQGVYLNNGAHDNIVGSPDPADRNVIGNYDKAVYSNGPGTNNNTIQDNMLCMKADGSTAICQTGIDFDFGPKNNLVGGSNANEGNVVGPTCCNGVELSHGWDPAGLDTTSKWLISGNRIIGNWLGFRADGSYDPAYRSAQSVPTYDNGQAINVYDGSPNNTIQGNYVASVYDGITVASLNTTGNVVQGNIIGKSPLGQAAPLAGWGIYLRWDTDVHSLIGNHISNAATGGIGLIEYNVTRITISQNTVDSTSGPALYFAPDPNNPATGANELLAAPALSATLAAVSGTALPRASVDVYRASGSSGQAGLPLAYLGTAIADGSGAWSLPLTLNTGDLLTAQQTRSDGTSSLLAPDVAASDAQTPPTASFTWTQSSQSTAVTFTDTSTGQPASWSWDFGDGSQSVGQSPVHIYATEGDYTVVLTASNSAGQSQTTQTVHVAAVATVYAADGFGRQVTGGWSSADVGGAYALLGDTGNYNVAGGTGQMIVPKASATRQAILGGTTAGDVDIKVRFAIDKLPAGGAQYVYLIARSIGTSSYRPKVIVNANGTVAVHAGLVNNGTESSLGASVLVPGLTATAGGYMWLRAQVTGTNPTTIKVRAWRDGDTEPSTWQLTATNSLAVLQAAGALGIAACVGSGNTNAPVTFAFDDLIAVDPNGSGPVAPTASYTYAQEQNTLVVDFTDRSTGAPTSWAWDFGDGTTSSQRNPTKTYATGGAYQVTLTVANSAGQSSASQLVSVATPTIITYAQDSFGRTVSGGWGDADVGGTYNAAGGAAAVNVANGTGLISPPRAGATRGVTLDSVAARDVDILVRLAVDKLPVGGTVWAYEVARHNGNNEYRPKILLKPDGTIAVHAGIVVSDAESPIGQPVTVPGLTYGAGTFIWLHAQITGTNPTTIKIRAWADGQPEPTTWQYTATDSTSVLQQAGSVGLRVYDHTAVTNAPVTVSFDDYRVVSP